MVRALGLKNFSDIIKRFQAGGASLENETAFEVAKQGNLPVIVSTDAKLKKDKYEHIGMKHVNTRTLGKKSFIFWIDRTVGAAL